MPRKALERTNTSWRISAEAQQLLESMAEKLGLSQSAVFEQAIREKAQREKVTGPSQTEPAMDRQETARARFQELIEKARAGFDDMTPEEVEEEVRRAVAESRENRRAGRH
jgi:predicted transcriptional regulator